MTAKETRGPSPRERLLASASELFYAEGVQSVGIDRVLEHAGVARASLYSTYGSKEALVRAYLDARHQSTVSNLAAAVALHSDPRERLLAVFDAQGDVFKEPGFNGCAFVSASAEAHEGGLVAQATEDYRTWIRGLFLQLSQDAGVADAPGLALRLHLLYDGAGLCARMDRDPAAAVAAKDAAATLLEAWLRSS